MPGFSIVTNVSSLLAQENLSKTNQLQQTTITRLTSGLRINSSADDAAGLAIANRFRSDIAVLQQGVRNAADGLSTLQTIDGGINNVSLLLDRARSLATQSASGTFLGDRSTLNSEFQSVINEIDRQAQAVGLDPGGSFNALLSVFIGGGRANNGLTAVQNGSVQIDLTQSAFSANNLGLKGVQAIGGTEGTTDIGTGAASTSVSDIAANATNVASLRTAGFTEFTFAGAGFSDTNRVTVAVNLSGIVDSSTLATAINDSIVGLSGSSEAAQAFKNAGVKAVINTDSTGKQQLTFTSSNTAFQVEAGDRLANALLGNYTSTSDPTGKTLDITLTAAANASSAVTTFTSTTTIKLRIESGGLADAEEISVSVSGAETVGSVLSNLNTAFAANSNLASAGFSLTANAGAAIVVTNSKGERFNVFVSGDQENRLGLGSFRLGGSGGTDALYTEITGGANAGVTFGATIGISVGGGAVISLATANDANASDTTRANELNSLIAASATLSAAGLQATVSAGAIKILSNNGSEFQLTVVSDANASFGFGIVAGTTTLNALAEASGFAEHTILSGGADASTTGDVTAFRPIIFGTDDQTITITAPDTNGAQQSLSVVLRNDATARTGRNIDEALQYINQQLQQSNNTTLKQIVAVKERNDAGTGEGIRFVSTLPDFQVSIGQTANGTGLNNGTAQLLTSDELAGGNIADISTKENAATAVSLLAEAVTKLAAVQADVGKGQNQLQFAIGLATTQITNLSAAESRIRDADLAVEAANLTRASIAQQAGVAALAQANSAPQAVLALLRG